MKIWQSWNFWILVLLGVVVAVGLGITIFNYPKLFEDYAGTVSLISLLVAIFTFFFQQQSEKLQAKEDLNDRIRRFCEILKTDNEQIRKAITGKEFDKVYSKKGNTSTTVYLSTKIYDSLIYSGLIIHFQQDTQLNLDNLYYKIERNNDNIQQRTDVIVRRDSTRPNPGISSAFEVIENYNELIFDYQKEILELLDKVKINIQNELNRL